MDHRICKTAMTTLMPTLIGAVVNWRCRRFGDCLKFRRTCGIGSDSVRTTFSFALEWAITKLSVPRGETDFLEYGGPEPLHSKELSQPSRRYSI